jgi:hypothetical protein
MTTKPPIPRRWNVELDGIRWLPRMIDKARMRGRGELGSYLLGHSPVDHGLLTRAGVSTEQFAGLVRAAADDDAVLAALRSRDGWDEARVRRWSDRFTTSYRRYIPLWDLDEGYLHPNALQALGMAVFRPIERSTMALVRRVRRAP